MKKYMSFTKAKRKRKVFVMTHFDDSTNVFHQIKNRKIGLENHFELNCLGPYVKHPIGCNKMVIDYLWIKIIVFCK